MSDKEVAADTAAGQPSAQSTAAPAVPEKKTVEEWAKSRGHVDPPADKPAAIPDHKAWIFRCAKALHGWAIGCELTAEQYDDAIAAAMNVPIR